MENRDSGTTAMNALETKICSYCTPVTNASSHFIVKAIYNVLVLLLSECCIHVVQFINWFIFYLKVKNNR